jgi:multiple sugar transport system substrate-binding protein
MLGYLSRRRLVLALGASGLAALSAACGGGLPTPTAKPAEKPPEKPAAAAPTTAPAKPTEAAKPADASKPAAAAEPTKPAAAAATKPAEAPKPAAPVVGAGQTQVEFWFWADDPYQATLHTDSLKKFQEKNPKVAVKTDLIVTAGDQRKKLLTAFAAQAGMPDVSHGTGGWLPEYYDAKMIVPLEARLKNWKTFEDWLPAIQKLSKGGRAQDQIGIVTNQILVPYLYYRADWLAEAKVKPPDTLDEMLEVARALNKPPERYGFGFRGGDGGSLGQQVGLYLKADGVDFVKDDGSTVDLDSPDAIARVNWYAELVTKHKVTQPSAATDRFPELFAGLQGGKLALLHHGLWSWKTQETVLKEKVSAAPIPSGKKGRFASVGVEGTILYTTSKKQDEGWEVAAFLGEPEQDRLFMYERGSGPILKTLAEDKIFKENRFYKAALDSQPGWGEFPGWHPNWPKMSDRWGPEIQRLIKGEIDAERFCKTLADVLRKG